MKKVPEPLCISKLEIKHSCASLCNCRFLREASSSIHPKLGRSERRRGKQDCFTFLLRIFLLISRSRGVWFLRVLVSDHCFVLSFLLWNSWFNRRISIFQSWFSVINLPVLWMYTVLFFNGWILVHLPPQGLNLGIFFLLFAAFWKIRFDVLEVLDVCDRCFVWLNMLEFLVSLNIWAKIGLCWFCNYWLVSKWLWWNVDGIICFGGGTHYIC